MSKRLRPKAVATIERKKRIVTYVAVQREIVTLGPVPAALALVMRELRASSGLTQQSAADAMGISRPALANIEAGRQRVMLEDVWEYARVYGTTPVKLFALVAKHADQPTK
jgi:DNA-binding XRE family transcriptional regulator